jgi:Ti-type conjugative transfer relaxase TraA
MANYHLSMQVISRSEGRKAVAAAAYRRGARFYDERYDMIHDYSNKDGVIHSEFSIPDNAPQWLRDITAESGIISQDFWNIVEESEKRKDAQLCREVEFSLPVELTKEQGIALAKEYIQDQFVSLGMVADWSVHWDNPDNPHVHCLLTMRPLSEDGFGKKKAMVLDPETGVAMRDRNGSIVYQRGDVWGSKEQMIIWREQWAAYQNFHLRMHGHSVQVDHRSYKDQGIRIEPTNKLGVRALWMERMGLDSDRCADHVAIKQAMAAQLSEDPSALLDKLVRQHSTFSVKEMEREIGRYATKGSKAYHLLVDAISAHPALIHLGQKEGRDYFTVTETVDAERRMIESAQQLSSQASFAVQLRYAERSIAALNRELAATSNGAAQLSEQQIDAAQIVLQEQQLSVLVGAAGAGKSTILQAANDAWVASGYRVKGAALSGVAAANLQESGIHSQTLHSLLGQMDLAQAILGANIGKPLTENQRAAVERGLLTNKDVLVIDEAGMIGSRQMDDLLIKARQAGAKVVLVGDAEQLQSIDAGAAFRDICSHTGYVALDEVRRQREQWQRDASRQFASQRGESAVQAYMEHGHVSIPATNYTALHAWLVSCGFSGKGAQDYLTVARYVESKQESGRIFGEAEEQQIAITEHPEYLRFRQFISERKLAVSSIHSDMSSHYRFLKHFKVDELSFTTDALVGLGISRAEALQCAAERVPEYFNAERIPEELRVLDKDLAARSPAATPGRMTTQQQLVQDYMEAHWARPEASRMVLAYTRNDVTILNRSIQQRMMEIGTVSQDTRAIAIRSQDDGGEFQITEHFAVGDRIMFRHNDKEMGVMNGSLGTIRQLEDGHQFAVELDNGKQVSFSSLAYDKFQLGYAATVHKSQGVTIDETYVLASRHFDKHTSYVAMTRHRDKVQVYAPESEYGNSELLKEALTKAPERYTTLDFAKAHGITPVLENKRSVQELWASAQYSITQAIAHVAELWSRLDTAYGKYCARDIARSQTESKEQEKVAMQETLRKGKEERILDLRQKMLHAANLHMLKANQESTPHKQIASLVSMSRYAQRAVGLQVPDKEPHVTHAQLEYIQPQVRTLQSGLQEFKRANRELAKEKEVQAVTDSVQQAVFKAHPELQKEKEQERDLEL